MKAYKGFNEDMICHGFQYEEGKEYTYDREIKLNKSGFHACKNPLDIFKYYYPCYSVYHEVEIYGDIIFSENDSSLVSSKIRIGKRISLIDLIMQNALLKENENEEVTIESQVNNLKADYRDDKLVTVLNKSSISSTTGSCSISKINDYYSIAASTGDYSCSHADVSFSIAASTGFSGVAIADYSSSIAANTDLNALALANGDNNIAANTGSNCKAETLGLSSIAATSHNSIVNALGENNVAVSTGDYSFIRIDKASSIGIAWGKNIVAKGVLGSTIVFSIWDNDIIKDNKIIKIDGTKYKENTWYTITDNEVVEYKEKEYWKKYNID